MQYSSDDVLNTENYEEDDKKAEKEISDAFDQICETNAITVLKKRVALLLSTVQSEKSP
jgi:hypothetical protein